MREVFAAIYEYPWIAFFVSLWITGTIAIVGEVFGDALRGDGGKGAIE